ncbi:MAG: hypothetical protein MZV70_37325 [Desulfobacterales bacterium]|nr:hypothetical protein [Desulfobacterales bacterium]
MFCIGEDIGIPGGWGGAFTGDPRPGAGVPRPHGRTRRSPRPGSTGVALGAAMMGLRPIADVQYADFLFCAMDQVANQVAKMRYMSGGAARRCRW